MHEPEPDEEETALISAQESVPQCACEPVTAATEGILVDLDTGDWLKDLNVEVLSPTLSHLVSSVCSESSLFQDRNQD